jgi:protein O-mannosyl-transferase
LADKKENIELSRGNPVVTWICVAAIALVTYFVFSPSLKDGFTNWDDNKYVTENPLVVNNSVPVAKIFETPVSGHYHPLTILTLAFNYQTGKLNPMGYHFENVIFHLLNTILVFFFIFLLTRRNLLMAAIVSLFFGIHPMHVESVTWISERKDVLYVFFFIAGLITYLRYSETKKIGWYFFTLLLFVLSCLSKEMAIVFPVILLLIDYLKGVKWERRLFVEKIPFFLIAIILGVIEVKIQSGNTANYIKIFTIFQRLMFASYAAIIYIVKLFAPYKLSAFYPYPNTHSYNGAALIFYLSSPFILIAILSGVVYFFLKKEKEIVFGLLFYFVSVLLVVQFVPLNPGITPDRYSYLSYIGLLFIAAYLINKAWQSKSGVLALMKYPLMIIAIIGAVTFSYRSSSRTQVWKNSEVLWTDAIDNYPGVLAYKARGDYYYSIHEIDKAISDFNKAVALDSSYKYVYNNRGLLYLNTGKTDLALPDFDKAIALDSTYTEAYINRGLLYSNTGKTNLAMSDLNKAIALDSTYADAYNNLGLLYFKTGKNDSALTDFTKAIALAPAYADAYNNLGLFYYKTGKANLAIADFSKVIALDSKMADAYNNRGSLYYLNGKNDSALADFTKAIAINPAAVSYYFSRGCCYRKLNQYEKAADDFTTGIRLNPQNADNYNMRGVCYLNLNRYTESIADFSKAIELNPFVPYYWDNRSSAENKAGNSKMAKADEIRAEQLQEK